MYVCICKAVTTQMLVELAETGIRRTKDIGEACGAGTVCAKCRPSIRSVVEAVFHAQQTATSEDQEN
jgi:bacterioferritin-associated ferredoxin